MCRKETGRGATEAFWARWDLYVSVVSVEAQTNQEETLECIISGEDGGLRHMWGATSRNSYSFLSPCVMLGTVLAHSVYYSIYSS